MEQNIVGRCLHDRFFGFVICYAVRDLCKQKNVEPSLPPPPPLQHHRNVSCSNSCLSQHTIWFFVLISLFQDQNFSTFLLSPPRVLFWFFSIRLDSLSSIHSVIFRSLPDRKAKFAVCTLD